MRWGRRLFIGSAVACACGLGALGRSLLGDDRVGPFRLKLTRELATHGVVTAVAWSSDGSTLAAASNYGQDLTVWNVRGEIINRFKRVGGGPYLSNSLAFVSGSTQLLFPPGDAGGDRMALDVWDIKTGQILRSVEGPEPNGDYAQNRAATFDVSPDGTLAFGAPSIGNKLLVWRTADWTEVAKVTIAGGVACAKFFPNGRSLAVGQLSGHWLTVSAVSDDIISNHLAYDLKWVTFNINAIAISPMGDLVATGMGLVLLDGRYERSSEANAALKHQNSVLIWKSQDGHLVGSLLSSDAPIRAIVWDPKARYLAIVDSKAALTVWDPHAAEPSYSSLPLPGSTMALAVDPSGGLLAAATERGVQIFTVTQRK
jgi:WD domain, G-beta repeat